MVSTPSDLNTFLIMSNLAVSVAVLYLILVHHNRTMNKKAHKKQ